MTMKGPSILMIREGQRGEGNCKKATWDEALGHIAKKLKAIIKKHGIKAIALSDRGGLFFQKGPGDVGKKA